MYKQYIVFLLFFLGVCGGSVIGAKPQNTDSQKLPISEKRFNLAQANQRLENLALNLTKKPKEIRFLENSIRELLFLEDSASLCFKSAQDELNEIKDTLKKIPAKDQAPEVQFLESQAQIYLTRASACQLVRMRSKNLIDDFRDEIQFLETKILFKKEAPFWNNITKLPQILNSLYQDFNLKKVSEIFQIQNLNFLLFSMFVLFGFSSVILAIQFKKIILKRTVIETTEEVGKLIYQSFLVVLTTYPIPLFLSFFLFLFFSLFDFLDVFPRIYLLIASVTLGIIVFLITSEFLFYPPKPAKKFHKLPENLTKILIFRLKTFSVISALGTVSYIFFHNQAYANETMNVIRTAFVSILSINVISVVWLITRLPRLIQNHPVLRLFIRFILSLALIGTIGVEWLGYYSLSAFLLTSFTCSIGLYFCAWFLHKSMGAFLDSLEFQQTPWQIWIHKQLGVKPGGSLPELLGVRVGCYILIWSGFFLFILKQWEFPDIHYYRLIEAIFEGFTVSDVLIKPFHILLGVLSFTLFFWLSRWFKTQLIQQRQSKRDWVQRQAIATILGYIGFSVAVLAGLLIAGVNFTGLAVVAGALSVGIGFGLQNIVNDFVSGLIILIERQVKVGDRIIVRGTEGFVRKISIRSTQIITLERTDIIVPNSEIITTQLTNFMFQDQVFRVTIKVSVRYGSNVDLVKQTLIEVARAHPEVMAGGENEPDVFFMEFGNSGLLFELWCYISNVNLRFLVLTDLNFAVDRKFRERGIIIAFPQRDLHIVDWPEALPILPKEN